MKSIEVPPPLAASESENALVKGCDEIVSRRHCTRPDNELTHRVPRRLRGIERPVLRSLQSRGSYAAGHPPGRMAVVRRPRPAERRYARRRPRPIGARLGVGERTAAVKPPQASRTRNPPSATPRRRAEVV